MTLFNFSTQLTLRITFLLLVSLSVSGQIPGRVRFKKEQFFFFRQGIASDTVASGKVATYYLVVPDSLKKDIVINTLNCRLERTANDSLVNIIFFPGFKYECFFKTAGNDPVKSKSEIQTFIDGAAEPEKHKCRVTVSNRREEKVMIDNELWFISP